MSFRERLRDHRWFARFEGETAPLGERSLVLVLAYVIGGLGYLAVNRFVGDGPFRHLELPVDRAIPFVPAFSFFYVLVYVTPACSAIFVRDRAELYRTFLAFGLNAAICFPIFLAFPVEFPRLMAIPDTLAGSVLVFVHRLDRPVNCFPSHHVSTAVTTYIAVRRQSPGWGRVLGLAALAVAVSTLLVKQHYLVDVLAGVVVASATAWISYPPLRRALQPGRSGVS